jgi:hypothetical protein
MMGAGNVAAGLSLMVSLLCSIDSGWDDEAVLTHTWTRPPPASFVGIWLIMGLISQHSVALQFTNHERKLAQKMPMTPPKV